MNAPSGLQQLRDLILYLAASGKLVSTSDTSDTAMQMLEDIRRIQDETYGARERSELKTLPLHVARDSSEISAKLGHIARIISGQHLTPNEYHSQQIGIPYITGPAEFGVRFPVPSKWTNERRAVAESGDILITVKGSGVGKLNLCDIPELAISRQLMAVRPLGEIDIEYIWICLNASRVHFQSLKTGIAIPGIGREDVLTLDVRLPPLEEQKRIVAKVDELMRLCDRLEAQQKEREKLLPLLSRANHTRFVAEPTSASLRAIFQRSGSVAATDLRQTIRDLAIRGRLVAQRPTDTPVKTLLDQILTTKSERSLSPRRTQRNSTIGQTASAQFDTPDTWAWVFLGDVVMNRDGERIPVSKDERAKRRKVYDYYGASGIIDKIDAFLFNKPLLLIGEDGANLINRSTPIAFMARGEYWVNNQAHVLDGISEDFLRYIELFINAINLPGETEIEAAPNRGCDRVDGQGKTEEA